MGSDVEIQPQIINSSWLQANRNHADKKSCFDRILDHSQKAVGSQRILSLLRSIAILRNALGSTPSFVAEEIQNAASISIAGLRIVGLLPMTNKAYRAVIQLGKEDGGAFGRKVGLAIRDTFKAVNSWCKASIFLGVNSAPLYLSQITSFGGSLSEFCLSIHDWQLVTTFEEAATGEIREAYTHTRHYQMLRVAKSVLSLVSAFFTALMFFTGVKLIPLAGSIFLTFVLTLLTMRRDFFKSEGRFKLISVS